MTNKLDFRTYLYLNHNQFIIYVDEILTNEKIYSEKLEIEENFTEFICLSKNLIENIEKILKKYHISLNQILSASYLEKIKDNTDNTIFTTASRIISGHNTNEVLLIGKINKKQGFFERFFNFFN